MKHSLLPDDFSIDDKYADLNVGNWLDWISERLGKRRQGVAASDVSICPWYAGLNEFIEAQGIELSVEHDELEESARPYMLEKIEEDAPLVYQAMNYNLVNRIDQLPPFIEMHNIMKAEDYAIERVR